MPEEDLGGLAASDDEGLAYLALFDDQSLLAWLQGWYMSNCDGYWEHGYGVSIETLDNPGWAVRLELTDTVLEARPFERFEHNRGEHDWLQMWIEDATFHIACGPLNLGEGLFSFRAWVQGEGAPA